MRKWLELLRDKRGVGAIEYALVASIISISAIVAFNNLGDGVDGKFQSVESKM